MMHHLVIWFAMQQKTAQVANLIMGIAAGLWFLAVMRRVLHAMKLNHFLKLMEVPIEIRLVNFPVSEPICLILCLSKRDVVLGSRFFRSRIWMPASEKPNFIWDWPMQR